MATPPSEMILPVTKPLKESSRPESGWPLLPFIMIYINKAPYTINCVASVTINGCSWNFATKKPLTQPTIPPTTITAKITSGIGTTPRFGNILVEYVTACSREAEIHAVNPTTRPADRSVPVNTIHPAIPHAIGIFAADKLTILTKDEGENIKLPDELLQTPEDN